MVYFDVWPLWIGHGRERFYSVGWSTEEARSQSMADDDRPTILSDSDEIAERLTKPRQKASRQFQSYFEDLRSMFSAGMAVLALILESGYRKCFGIDPAAESWPR